jgi:hypothetical protein
VALEIEGGSHVQITLTARLGEAPGGQASGWESAKPQREEAPQMSTTAVVIIIVAIVLWVVVSAVASLTIPGTMRGF